ncbi:MAG: response regulator [Gemmatimonadaceae bacterium]|nr:response regulator [Gemmatimonadaceae bacterium]
MPNPRRSVLWVDDEAELLESHRLFLRDNGYDVLAATNADDAIAMLARHPVDAVLLDEQMPGKRGLEAYRELREIQPGVAVVMVTKSEDPATLREALGADVKDYLVKPLNPRQVLAALTRLLDGPNLRRQQVAQDFVQRFRSMELAGTRDLDWRGWMERAAEVARWDVDLAAANELGLLESLRGLLPAMQRDFAEFIGEAYPKWLADLDGDRPPLSVDVVPEFLLPLFDRHKAAILLIVDCLRLDQWLALESLVTPWFDIETTHYFSVLPTATPYARNAIFAGLFPGEIAAMHPDWWGPGEREEESLNAHEKELLVAQLRELGRPLPVRYTKVTTAHDANDLERRLSSAIAPEGISAFVFNFVDLLTHGRSESTILLEVARDELALRQITRQWVERSVMLKLLREAARRGIPVLVTSDHGSIHCQTPATIFARRDATNALRFKFGEDIRAEKSEHALRFASPDALRLPRRPGSHESVLLATGDTFFVYPTKLREYQSRYRGAFLHGGVTPEEVVLPLALLTPRG